MANEIEKIKKLLHPLLKKEKIRKAGIFGSYARDDQTKDSDVDILIELDGSLLDLIRIERELEKKLKKKVDLLTYNSISPYLKKRILEEEVRIYEKER